MENSLGINSSHTIYLNVSETKYYTRQGKIQSYFRTTRVDKKDTLIELVKHLQTAAMSYLEHRFAVNNDKFYWN